MLRVVGEVVAYSSNSEQLTENNELLTYTGVGLGRGVCIGICDAMGQRPES